VAVDRLASVVLTGRLIRVTGQANIEARAKALAAGSDMFIGAGLRENIEIPLSRRAVSSGLAGRDAEMDIRPYVGYLSR
jgi:hypothetical protein